MLVPRASLTIFYRRNWSHVARSKLVLTRCFQSVLSVISMVAGTSNDIRYRLLTAFLSNRLDEVVGVVQTQRGIGLTCLNAARAVSFALFDLPVLLLSGLRRKQTCQEL